MANERVEKVIVGLQEREIVAASWMAPDGRTIVLKSWRGRRSGKWLGVRGTIVTPNDGAGVAQFGRLVRR